MGNCIVTEESSVNGAKSLDQFFTKYHVKCVGDELSVSQYTQHTGLQLKELFAFCKSPNIFIFN